MLQDAHFWSSRCDRLEEAPPGPMDAHPGSARRASEHAGDLRRPKALPGHEHEQLPLLFGERSQAQQGDKALLVSGKGAPRALGKLSGNPIDQFGAAPPAPVLVMEHIAGHGIEPEDRLLADGDLIEPAPGDRERLGRNVGGVFG